MSKLHHRKLIPDVSVFLKEVKAFVKQSDENDLGAIYNNRDSTGGNDSQ